MKTFKWLAEGLLIGPETLHEIYRMWVHRAATYSVVEGGVLSYRVDTRGAVWQRHSLTSAQ